MINYLVFFGCLKRRGTRTMCESSTREGSLYTKSLYVINHQNIENSKVFTKEKCNFFL